MFILDALDKCQPYVSNRALSSWKPKAVRLDLFPPQREAAKIVSIGWGADILYCDSVGPLLVNSPVKFLRRDSLCHQVNSYLSYTDLSPWSGNTLPVARCARPAGAQGRPPWCHWLGSLVWGELTCPRRQRESLGMYKPEDVNSARRTICSHHNDTVASAIYAIAFLLSAALSLKTCTLFSPFHDG